MENENDKIIQYIVPSNVSARFEFFNGFGFYELRIVLTACAIGVVIFFLLGTFKKPVPADPNTTNKISIEMQKKEEPVIPDLIRTLFIIVPTISAFFLVKKEPTSGQSLLIIVKAMRIYKKRQKRYLYKYNSGTEE